MHYDFMYGLRQMEAELIRWYIDLLNGTDVTCGTFTSGGTESIFMALVSMREYGRVMKGITEPEFIMPTTAHPAFNKSCYYLGIKCVVADVHKKNGYVLTANEYKKLINSNTIGVSVFKFKHLLILMNRLFVVQEITHTG
jgi:sphinganine-1-phosphate aldolase